MKPVEKRLKEMRPQPASTQDEARRIQQENEERLRQSRLGGKLILD